MRWVHGKASREDALVPAAVNNVPHLNVMGPEAIHRVGQEGGLICRKING